MEKRFYYGNAYYPEAWEAWRVEQEIDKMQEIGFNTVRVAEFAWAEMEKSEGNYDFSLFRKVVDYRMVHLVSKDSESSPTMNGNTYIQKAGNILGRYGANGKTQPENIFFDKNVQLKINHVLKDENAEVYIIE